MAARSQTLSTPTWLATNADVSNVPGTRLKVSASKTRNGMPCSAASFRIAFSSFFLSIEAIARICFQSTPASFKQLSANALSSCSSLFLLHPIPRIYSWGIKSIMALTSVRPLVCRLPHPLLWHIPERLSWKASFFPAPLQKPS